jgi:hypothetical protein
MKIINNLFETRMTLYASTPEKDYALYLFVGIPFFYLPLGRISQIIEWLYGTEGKRLGK